jgi:hypothetical protein
MRSVTTPSTGPANRLQTDDLELAPVLQLGELAVIDRVAQLGFAELLLGRRFVAQLLRHEVLAMQLLGALRLLGAVIDSRLPRPHRALHLRALLGDRSRRAVDGGVEHRELLALLHEVAAIDIDALDQSLDRAAQLEHLARLDHAIELCRERRGAPQQSTDPSSEHAAARLATCDVIAHPQKTQEPNRVSDPARA